MILDSPIYVWGAGAMGGSIGGALANLHRSVLFVDSDREHCLAIAENGLRVTGPVQNFTVVAGEYEHGGLLADLSLPRCYPKRTYLDLLIGNG